MLSIGFLFGYIPKSKTSMQILPQNSTFSLGRIIVCPYKNEVNHENAFITSLNLYICPSH